MAHHYKRIDRCDRCERSQTNDVTPAQVRADGAIDMPTVTFDTKPTAPSHLREVVGTLCDKCAESFKAWWGEHGARLNGPADDERKGDV